MLKINLKKTVLEKIRSWKNVKKYKKTVKSKMLITK